MTPRPTTARPLRAVSYARNSAAKQRSIERQARENREAAAAEGWTLTAELSDGSSASRYARKPRENWTELLRLLPDTDVVILWEASRGDRRLSTWIAFLEECRDRGVRIHATGYRRTYDPRDEQDYHALADAGVNASRMAGEQSNKLLSGFAEQARNGRPTGRTTYGFVRVYDERTRELVEQREHPDHAGIVREIVQRIGQGHPVNTVARDLTARGVPTPRGAARWSAQAVREIAVNRAYIGVRVHQVKRGQVTEHPAIWPALVSDADHYAAMRMLTAPERRAHLGPRPGGATTLLGNLAVCGDCGKPCRSRSSPRGAGPPLYEGPHAAVRQAEADEWVGLVVVEYLSRDDVFLQLRHASDDEDAAVVTAREELDRLTNELKGWRQSAVDGVTSPDSLAVIEEGLKARIKAAERQALRSSVPPALRALVGPGGDVTDRWQAAPLGAQREALRSWWEIRLWPSRGRGKAISDRVEIVKRPR